MSNKNQQDGLVKESNYTIPGFAEGGFVIFGLANRPSRELFLGFLTLANPCI